MSSARLLDVVSAFEDELGIESDDVVDTVNAVGDGVRRISTTLA